VSNENALRNAHYCREWSDFTDKPCPYHFSDDEVRQHQEEGAAFNESQDFWESVHEIVTDEGYTSTRNFEKAVEIFQKLRDAGLNNLQGEERNEFERQTRWVQA
jgi:pentatricopeptide repeat protein